MTMNKITAKLRKHNKAQYRILGTCIFLSVLLVSAFTFMFFSPTVQTLLPDGGDSRKLSWLLLFVTIIGCTIFTLYGANLFFKYKSREFGVFLALGEQKKQLRNQLAKELAAVIVKYVIWGILLALPASYLIWKLFQLLIVNTTELKYSLSIEGAAAGLLFSAFLVLCILITGIRFIKRSNIMDILNDQRKTEMVKEIKPNTWKIGLFLIVTGLFLAMIVPAVVARVCLFLMPAIWNATYLLCIAGLYLLMLSAVGHSKKGKNPNKYYKNIISTNLMRFTARQTTKNMCVITMLIFVMLISAFWGMTYYDSVLSSGDKAGYAHLLHYPAAEQQLSKDDIESLAQKHGLAITDYEETDLPQFIIHYTQRDLTDGGKYFDIQSEKLASFLSASDFNRITGATVSLNTGEYKTVVPADYAPSIWVGPDCLNLIENPVTGMQLKPAYMGTEIFDDFMAMSAPFTFILSDKDFKALSAGMNASFMEKLVLFNVSEKGDAYTFAAELRNEYIAHATSVSDHMGLYDAHEEALALSSGETYGYAGSIGPMSPDNPQLLGDWKYAPFLKILQKTSGMQMIAVFLLLSIYISIISLSAVGIMSYVRSITIAMDNRQLFHDLQKLGADNAYVDRVIKMQLTKIFSYPAAAGCGIGFLFALIMSYSNDGRMNPSEFKMLGVESAMIVFIVVFICLIYRVSFRKMKNIIKE